MSNQEPLISLKVNNYNYAPGIATYGIDGQTGELGVDGNNIYFTDFNINAIQTDLTEDSDLSKLIIQIKNNYLPIKGSETKISRFYKNGDLFFDKFGVIYKLCEYDKLMSDAEIQSYEVYFDIAGLIKTEDTSGYFNFVNTRLVMNDASFNGFDILAGNCSSSNTSINEYAAVNIISDAVDENDNIELVKMQSIDDTDIEDGTLKIYYKTTENAYYLDSNKPIIINGDLKLNNTNVNTEYDDYSTVLTAADTITYFKHICDKLNYVVLYDPDTNNYNIALYSTEDTEDLQIKTLEYLIQRNETIYGKIYTNGNDLILTKLSQCIQKPVSSSNYYDYMPDAQMLVDDTLTALIIINNATYDTNISFTNDEVVIGPSPNDISYNYINVQSDNFNYNIEITDSPVAHAVKLGISDTFEFNVYPRQPYTTNDITYPYVTYPGTILWISSNRDSNIEYTAYFTSFRDPNTNSVYIRNYMISKDSNLLNRTDIGKYAIVIPVPENIDSILRFSLMYNTEIFINYKE